ncbi:MAG: entericidin A/B family lipoprotein [Lysobacterales bacterium]
MQNHKTLARLMLTGLLASIALSACNTVEGVGKDAEAVGEEIQEEANEARD